MWLIIALPSLLVGVICGAISRSVLSAIVAAGLPWFALLSAIVYETYFKPYQGGGASMWLVAQFFGGTIAAACGYAGFWLIGLWRKRNMR